MPKTKGKSGRAGEDSTLDQSPSHLLHRVLQLALDLYSTETGPDGLTQRQYAVLTAVAHNPGLTQTDLVKSTGIDRSTLADMVARMISKGLLERERSTMDARANTVRLTEAGRAELNGRQAQGRRRRQEDSDPVAARQAQQFHRGPQRRLRARRRRSCGRRR